MSNELKISINKNQLEKLKTVFVPLLALVLFSLATILYLDIDKVPLTHPGNIKAADPFGHALVSEGIIETSQWNYFDIIFSLGQEKATNVQPPLYNINSALLTMFSGVPVWVTFYFLVCLSQAFFILITYLITKEVFDNTKTALISAAIVVLPLPVRIWLYGVYIGFWIQVGSYFFVMSFLWLFVRYFKRHESWTLIFMGICLTSVMLTHPQDLALLILPTAFVGLDIIIKGITTKSFKNFIKKAVLFGLIPLALFVTLLPRFLFVWGAQGSHQYKLGFYGFRNLYTREYLGGQVFPDIFFLPMSIRLLFITGLLILIILIWLNYSKKLSFPIIKYGKRTRLIVKKDKNSKSGKSALLLISTILVYFFIIYVSEAFLQGPYYFARARSLQPYISAPVVAFATYLIIQIIVYVIYVVTNFEQSWLRLLEYLIMIFLVLFTVASGLPQHKELVSQLQGEHISINEWLALQWIHKNTDKKDKVLFFGGIFQQENLYAKRITALIPMEELQRVVLEYINTNQTPIVFQGPWGGESTRIIHKYEKSFWDYGVFEEPSNTLNLLDFDYVIFQDLNQQFATINDIFASEYINNNNFIKVYDQSGYMILKNEKSV